MATRWHACIKMKLLGCQSFWWTDTWVLILSSGLIIFCNHQAPFYIIICWLQPFYDTWPPFSVVKLILRLQRFLHLQELLYSSQSLLGSRVYPWNTGHKAETEPCTHIHFLVGYSWTRHVEPRGCEENMWHSTQTIPWAQDQTREPETVRQQHYLMCHCVQQS